MRSEHATAAASPGFALWRATLRWQRLMVSTLRPHGLTHVQFVLLTSLWYLAEGSGVAVATTTATPSQRELAEHAGTDAMMTSQVLRALERAGHVERTADAADARVRRLALTDSGRQLVADALPAVERADREFFAGLPDAAAFAAGLQRLAGLDAGS